MVTKSRENIYGASVRAAAEQAAEARMRAPGNGEDGTVLGRRRALAPSAARALLGQWRAQQMVAAE